MVQPPLAMQHERLQHIGEREHDMKVTDGQ